MIKTFVLYQKYQKQILSLSNEEAGKLIKAIFLNNQDDSTEDIKLSPKTEGYFEIIKDDIQDCNNKYQERCKNNRDNVNKRWAKYRKNKEEDTKDTTVYDGKDGIRPNYDYNNNYNTNTNKHSVKNVIKEKESSVKIPSWIKANLWNEFLTIRLKLKAVNSDLAITGILNKLEKWKAKGFDPNEIIQNSIEGSWKIVYEPKTTKQTKTSGTNENLQNAMKIAEDIINQHNQK